MLPTKFILDVTLDGLPPSTNHAYFNLPRGGRTLTAKGKAYKTGVSSNLIRNHQEALKRIQKDAAYCLAVLLTFSDMYNATWPEKAATRYKKIDVSNRVKLLEDALVDSLGIDDSQFVTVILAKRQGDFESTRILVWDPNDPEVPTLYHDGFAI